MPPTGESYFALPDQGGLQRSPDSLHSHQMPGAAGIDLLRRALELDVSTALAGDQLVVSVEVTNVFGGHHAPTDSPLRHVMLMIEATDPDGASLPLLAGTTLPDWCGVGSGSGRHGGKPGKVFAKVLEELWTGISPTAAYWNQTTIVSDTRIPALATDMSIFTFEASSGATVTARLVFRRAPIDLIDRKGWQSVDIEMAKVTVTDAEDG